MPFYNSTNSVNPELKQSVINVTGQEERIKELFLKKGILSSWQIDKIFEAEGKSMFITSIRRTLTDLASDNFLIKTDIMVIGKFGAKEHLYKLSDMTNFLFPLSI